MKISLANTFCVTCVLAIMIEILCYTIDNDTHMLMVLNDSVQISCNTFPLVWIIILKHQNGLHCLFSPPCRMQVELWSNCSKPYIYKWPNRKYEHPLVTGVDSLHKIKILILFLSMYKKKNRKMIWIFRVWDYFLKYCKYI